MPIPRSRDLSNLRAYVNEHDRHPLSHRTVPTGVAIPLVMLVTIFGLYAATSFLSGFLAIVAFPFVLALLIGIFTTINSALQKPRNPQEEHQVRVYDAANYMGSAVMRRHLHPLAGRLLEACAHHRARIMQTVRQPAWESGHWKSVRDQALRAADEGMEEAMFACMSFTGPDQGPHAAWKDLAQDVAEGQLGGAVRRLQTMFEADSPGEIVDRRKLPQPLWPVYDIAVKMQRLATEMDLAARKASSETTATVGQPQTSLDEVLQNLGAMRQAEAELDQELRQGS